MVLLHILFLIFVAIFCGRVRSYTLRALRFSRRAVIVHLITRLHSYPKLDSHVENLLRTPLAPWLASVQFFSWYRKLLDADSLALYQGQAIVRGNETASTRSSQ